MFLTIDLTQNYLNKIVKNELKKLEDFYSNPMSFQTYSEKFGINTYKELINFISEEKLRIEKIIYEEIILITEPNALKLYLTKYIVRLSSLLQKNLSYLERYSIIDFEGEEKDLSPEEIEYYGIIFGVTDIFNEIFSIFICKIIDDHDFLFDSLDSDDLCNIIIDDYRKNPPNTNSSLISNTVSAKPQRLKTNLSVPQLALLFKMLSGLKPKIFDINADIDLHRFIKNNFETKNSSEDGISIENFRQDFSKPKQNTADFWEVHLRTMIAQVVKIQKN